MTFALYVQLVKENMGEHYEDPTLGVKMQFVQVCSFWMSWSSAGPYDSTCTRWLQCIKKCKSKIKSMRMQGTS